MTRFWKKNRIVSRLLASYVLLLLLPILIIWNYLLPQMQQRIVDTALMNHESSITRLSGAFEMQISSLVVSSVELANNPQLTAYAIQKSAMGDFDAQREVKKLLTPGGFVSRHFYYLKGNERFYSNTGAYPIEWLANTDFGYCYLDWPLHEMRDQLGTLQSLSVRPVERVEYPDHQSGSVLSVLVPVPMSSASPYAVLVAWVDEATLRGMIAPVAQEIPESTFLFDGAGQRLYALYDAQVPLTGGDLDQELLALPPEGVLSQVTLGGETFMYASAVQPAFGWRFVSLLPLAPLMEEVRAVRMNLLWIIVLLIVTSALIMAIAIRSHYLPIRTLVTKAGQYVDPQGQGGGLDVVHHALDHLNTQATALRSRVRDNVPIVREHLLYALVGGQFQTMEEFSERAREVGFAFSLPILCVTLIRTDVQEPSEIVEYLEKLSDSAPSGVEGHAVPAFNRQDVLLVCAGSSEGALRVYVTDTCADVGATFRCAVLAACGRWVEETARIQKSFNDASALLEKMAILEHTGVQFAAEQNKKGPTTTAALLYQIDFAIAKLDVAQIRLHVDALLAAFQSTGYSAAMIRALYSHAVESLLRGLDTLGAEGHDLTQGMAAGEVTYEAMEQNLGGLVSALVQAAQTEPEKVDVSVEEVRAYIEANCLDYAFSIQQAAEHFGMSYSGFSHFFKRNTGSSCKKFVDEYRAEQAIERIMNTMDPLENIAQEVGFANASSFIRSFKKVTGRTPGSYRNL